MKVCLPLVGLALAVTAHADLSIPPVAMRGGAQPRAAVTQDDDGESPDPIAPRYCAPLLTRALSSLRRAGADETKVLDGRSLLADFFLKGRTLRSPSLDVEVRVDCVRRPRTDPAWSDSDSQFERQVGHLQASFFIPPRSPALAFLAQLEGSLDRVLHP